MGEKVCRVMRTVISSPSDLIWDESATLSIFEGGLRRGEGNSSKACLGIVLPRLLPTGSFQNGK